MERHEIPTAGTKVVLTLLDIFGKPYQVRGTIMTAPVQHGYIMCSGAWSFNGGHLGDLPCYYVRFREYRKRKDKGLRVNEIQRCEVV